jgi:hypothetical protein
VTAFGELLLFLTKFKISSLVTRPSFPEPEILSNSATETPSSLAMFFTNGEKNLSEPEKSDGATDSLAASTALTTSATIGAAHQQF